MGCRLGRGKSAPSLAALLDHPLIDLCSQKGPVLDSMYLILWAASDPKMNAEAAKIDAPQFYRWVQQNSKVLGKIEGHKNVLKTILYLKVHARKAGAMHVNWVKVFSSFYALEFTGPSVKRFRGLQSVIWWLVRNAQHGSPCPVYCQERIIAFILANRDVIWDMIREKKEKTMIEYFFEMSKQARCQFIDWGVVIPYLVRKRKLFAVPVPSIV